ncbi:MAG: AI-2E family transporter [Prevotellaceae bacterium]|jgi:predicted PurR-regulated permease PerM|nr:AI-2E family transporter [Prevotellaceae bacterium]
MTIQERYWKYFLITFILLSGSLLFREFSPMLTGLLGAFTIYILVRRQMFFLTEKKKWNRPLAAVLLLLEVVLCILVPTFLTVWLLVSKLANINIDFSALIAAVQAEISRFNLSIDNYDLFNADNLKSLTSFVTQGLQIVVGEISSFLVNALVLLFILYFMLLNGRKMETYLAELLPFNEKNKKSVLKKVHSMVISNAVGIPLLAVVQGIIAFIGYLIFGVPDALLLALLTCFASIIPVVGTAIVWLPLCLFIGFTQNWWVALGLGAYCVLLLTNADNAVRFLLQKKMADTHPLITVFGVIIGLSLFGFWGIIFGPLFLSLFFLCVDIFKQEYLDKKG